MTQLAQTFAQLRQENRKGLIVYLTAGCPDYRTTLQAVRDLTAAGADIVEIGLPFSDPLADGPVIQKAATAALKAGATTAKTLALIKEVRQYSPIPLAVMTYVNTVLQYGVSRFVSDFAAAGVSGLIIPDLPAEECGLVDASCHVANMDYIQFVAPTSTGPRIAAICKKAGGFLYCISNTGVTGVRAVDYSLLKDILSQVRQHTDIPVAIGFGIGTPEAACAAARYAEAVIVGSAVMQRLMDGGIGAACQLIGNIRRALDEGGRYC